ncbi:MAG: hypothetical protein PVJ49_01685 [Acidobacteriota bacterium]
MFEFMGLMGVIFVLGLAFLAITILLLPFYILFRLLGFAVKVGVAGIFLAFMGLLLLPVALLVGLVLFFKLLIIGIPLLIAIAVFSFLVGFFRRDEPRVVYVEPQQQQPTR